jgi:hypothetical protein
MHYPPKNQEIFDIILNGVKSYIHNNVKNNNNLGNEAPKFAENSEFFHQFSQLPL